MFDHGLGEFCGSIKEIKEGITPQVIKDKFKGNEEFCKFVHKFCYRISGDMADLERDLKDKASKASINIFSVVHPSNIAYGILIFHVKEACWREAIKQRRAAKRKAHKDIDAVATKRVMVTRHKKKNANSQVTDEATAEASDEETEPAAAASAGGRGGRKRKGVLGRKGWTIGNRAKDRKFGFTEIGVCFYETVKGALMSIPVQEWESQWGEYYEKLDLKTFDGINDWEEMDESGEVGSGDIDVMGDYIGNGDDEDDAMGYFEA